MGHNLIGDAADTRHYRLGLLAAIFFVTHARACGETTTPLGPKHPELACVNRFLSLLPVLLHLLSRRTWYQSPFGLLVALSSAAATGYSLPACWETQGMAESFSFRRESVGGKGRVLRLLAYIEWL